MNIQSRKKALACALITLWIFFFVGAKWSRGAKITNIKIYIISVFFFFFVFFIASFIFSKVKVKDQKGKAEIVVSVCILLWFIVFVILSYLQETEYYPFFPKTYLRHNIYPIMYFFVLIVFTLILSWQIMKKSACDKKIRVFLSILIASIQGAFLYAPNFFKDTSGGMYHIDAYTNSIINSLSYMPHEQYSMSIYGHSGIALIIPLKILHLFGFNYWQCVTIAIAILGFLMFCVENWILSNILCSDSVFLLALVAKSVVSIQIYDNQFYQVLPNRCLFPALVIGGILLSYRKESKVIRFLLWAVSSLAILWNTETGIICIMVSIVATIYIDGKKSSTYKISIILKNMIFGCLSFAFAFASVNLYNVLVGGNIIGLKTFFYPIGSKSYPIENIQVELQIPWAGYIVVLIAMLGIVGWYMFDFIKLKLEETSFMVVMSAIMGIGVFAYYMNRAVSSNASIVCFTLTIVLAYIIDKNSTTNDGTNKEFEFNIKNMVRGMSLVILASMSLSSIATFGKTLDLKIKTTYETDTINEFVKDMDARLPEETVAFGMGTAQLFAYMNRTTGIYMADWEDLDQSLNYNESVINQRAIDYLNSQLEANRYSFVLVNQLQSKYIEIYNYEVSDTFEYEDNTFILYKYKG